jgi:hypothetical protein
MVHCGMTTPLPLSPAADELEATDGAPCPNCGSLLVRRYCPDCGQRRPGLADYSVRAHLADFTDSVVSGDGTVFRTVRALLGRPGGLTADHLAGRRGRYLRPIQLFLLVNLLLFVTSPRVPYFTYGLDNYRQFDPPPPALVNTLVERAAAERGQTMEEYTRDFDARVETLRKGLIILFAPALALLLWFLSAFRRSPAGVPRRFGEHMVFALNGLAFIWVILTAMGLILWLAPALPPATQSVAVVPLILALLAWVPVYAVLALRRAYALPVVSALAATVVLGVYFVVLLLAYRALMFFATFYSL